MAKCFPKNNENIAEHQGKRGENNECFAQRGKEGEKMLVCGRLSRSEKKKRASGITDGFWVTSVRTDGPAFPTDSPKDSNW